MEENSFTLIAITCIWIASKQKDLRPISICEVESSLGQFKYNKSEILKME